MALQVVAALERDQPEQPQGLPSSRPETVKQRAQSTPAENVGPEEATESLATGRGPAQKTEPPTLIVDALHRGDHSTLTGALKVASPGHRILVRPGLYKEAIVIDKPVEIVGDGRV